MKLFTKHPVFLPMVLWFLGTILLDQAARIYSLYYIFPGMDKVIHTMGGIALGLLALVLIDLFLPGVTRTRKFFLMVGMALLGGVLLEIGEHLFQTLHVVYYTFDSWNTVTDILCDTLGGIISFFYYTHES